MASTSSCARRRRGGGASAFVPAAECASSVPDGWDLSVSDACYIKYASADGDGQTRTCATDHIYFYISAQCLIDNGYTDGSSISSVSLGGTYAMSVTHYAQTAAGSTSRDVKIWWRDDKAKVGVTSGDAILQGRIDAVPAPAAFRANDYLVLPAYSSSYWT